MIKLGSSATEISTGLEGMITRYFVGLNDHKNYLFQPRGLSRESLTPLDAFWTNEKLIQGAENVPDVELPLQVLGTEVEDMASGFKGIALGLQLHISGCVHVEVQAKGVNDRTGEKIACQNFDIRRLKGAAIPPMTEIERAASQAAKPSPDDRHFGRGPMI